MQTVSQQCKNIKCGGQNMASANDFAWTGMSTILLVVLLVVLVAFGAYVIKTNSNNGSGNRGGTKGNGIELQTAPAVAHRAAGGSANVPPSPSGRKGVPHDVSGSALPAGWSTA